MYIYIYVVFFMGCCFSFNQEPRWTCDVFKFMIPFALWIAQETFICEVEVMKSESPSVSWRGRGNCFTGLESLSLQVFVFHFLFLFILLFSSPFLFTLQMLPNAMPATQTAAASTATNGKPSAPPQPAQCHKAPRLPQ